MKADIHDSYFTVQTVALPDWVAIVVLAAYAVVLAIAAREIWRATRHKGPPLPR